MNLIKYRIIFHFFVPITLVIMLNLNLSEAANINYDKYWAMAIELHKQNRAFEAENLLNSVINKYPNNAKLHLMRGKYKEKYKGDFQGAIIDYILVKKIAAKTGKVAAYPEVFWYEGMCYYKLGLFQQAISDYNNALKLKPTWGKLYLYRAKAYGKLNMIPQAIKDLKLCVKYDPKYASAAERLTKKLLTGEKDF